MENVIQKFENDGNNILKQNETQNSPVILPLNVDVFSLFHSFENILNYSRPIIVGLIFNLTPYFRENFHRIPHEQRDNFWRLFISLSETFTSSPEIEGLSEAISKFAHRSKSIHPAFLDFISDPFSSSAASRLRALLLTSLYDHFPPGYLTSNGAFFGSLSPLCLSIGTLHRRTRALQVLFSLNLSTSFMSSIVNLREKLWELVFEINELPDEYFSECISPLNKLKIRNSDFFELENPIISSKLDELENYSNDIEYSIIEINKLIRIFPFFPLEEVKRFLHHIFCIFCKFRENDWLLTKYLRQVFSTFIANKFNEKQISEIFEFISQLPTTSSKFFITSLFLDFFSDLISNFPNILLSSLCEWKTEENFNISMFCYVISNLDRYINKHDRIFLDNVFPTIFECIESNNETSVYFGIKCILHLWREYVITPTDFLQSIVSIFETSPINCQSYFFKLFNELLDSENEYSHTILTNLLHKLLTRSSDKMIYSLHGQILNSQCNLMEACEKASSIENQCLELSKNIIQNNNFENYQFAIRYVFYYVSCIKYFDNNLISPILNLIIERINQIPKSFSKVFNIFSFYYSKICSIFEGHFLYPIELLEISLKSSDPDTVSTSIDISRRLIQYYSREYVEYIMSELSILSLTTTHQNILSKTYLFYSKVHSLNPEIGISHVHSLKDMSFQGRLRICDFQPIYSHRNINSSFSSFVRSLASGHRVLSVGDVIDLIDWSSHAPAAALPSILDSVVSCILHDLFPSEVIQSNWEMFICLGREHWLHRKAFLSIIRLLDIISDKYYGIVNIHDFGQLMEFAFNEYNELSDSKIISFLPPILLHLYSCHYQFLELNFPLLNEIGHLIMELKYDWDYSEMVRDIVRIHERIGSLHTFSKQAAEVFVFFILMSEEERHEIGLCEEDISIIIETTKSIIQEDDCVFQHIITRFCSVEKEKEYVKELFGLGDFF